MNEAVGGSTIKRTEGQRSDRLRAIFRSNGDILLVSALSFAIGLGLWLRWSTLSAQSFWDDEGYSLWISQLSPRDIWRALLVDTGPPLYYTLLHDWVGLFGTSEAALRSLSALFASLSLPLFYLTARKIVVNRLSAAVATMIFSVSFFQIWYATEARCYALLSLLLLTSIYLALFCLEKMRLAWLLALGAVISASFYTHNVAILYVPGFIVLWFIYPAKATLRDRIRGALIAGAAACVLYLPWLPSFNVQRHSVNQGFWAPRPTTKDLLQTFCALSGFDTTSLQQALRSHFHTQQLFGVLTWAAICLCLFIVSVFGLLHAVSPVNRRKSIALLAYALLPLLLVFVISRLSTPIYITRLFIGSSILLTVAYCAPIAFQAEKRQILVRVVAFLVLIGATASAFAHLRYYRKEDWRGATEHLMKSSEHGRLVVVARPPCHLLVRYYLARLHEISPAPEITGLDSDFNLVESDFGVLQDRTTTPLLNKIGSEQHQEIDFILQPAAEQTIKLTNYLAPACSPIETIAFDSVEVRRYYCK
jgi:uncharacterized membrane protein